MNSADNNKTVLYLGGSITAGAGVADYEKSWARKSYNKISRVLFGENVRMINAAISGTNSCVATFRLKEHVLPYCPDFVFVEFSVNDKMMAESDPALSISCMEYIVRTLKAVNPTVAVTFIYAAARDGNAMATHHIVAEHYGIPEIDLYTPLKELVNEGHAVWDDYLCDAAHPNEKGHAVYAEQVANAVLSDPTRFLAPVSDVNPIGQISFAAPHIVYPRDAIVSHCNGFSIEPIKDRARLKRLSEMVIQECFIAKHVGDSITFEFEGGHFGIYHRLGNINGRFSVTVDGKVCGEYDAYHFYRTSPDIGEFVSRCCVHSLGAGRHSATVTIIEPNPNASACEIAIAGLFVE